MATAEQHRKWAKKNRVHLNAYMREWRKKNLAHARRYAAEWRKNNPEKVRKHNRAKVLGQYGLSLQQFDEMSEAQDGRCLICARIAKLCVDHSHTTGTTRGLLCRTCNVGLGHFQEDIELLTAAIKYLKQFSE